MIEIVKRFGFKVSLTVTAILCLIMANFLHFLVVSTATGLKETASWIFFIYFLLIYFMMLYTGRTAFFRQVMFVSTAMLLVPSFVAILYETRGSMAVNYQAVLTNSNPLCHIVIPFLILPYILIKSVIYSARPVGGYVSIYSMLLIWLLSTLFLGRGWCSWACFYGGWDDLFSRLNKKALLKINWEIPKIKYFSFAMLGFTVLASLITLTSVYCTWLCPFKLVTEYAAIDGLKTYLAAIMFILIFFTVVAVLPLLTRKRVQCTVYCPFGAFQSLLNSISPYRISIDTEKCSRCMRCAEICPTSSIARINIEEKTGKPGLTCTKCGECVDACPSQAISYNFGGRSCSEKTIFKIWIDRLSSKPEWAGHLSIFVLKTLDEILSPKVLFTFTAFLLGTVLGFRFWCRDNRTFIESCSAWFIFIKIKRRTL